jgi:hypothetical protein
MGRNTYIDLFKDMIPAIDQGIKELWDAAGPDGQKEIKGDFWNLTRYISTVRSSNRDTQELAIFKTNEYYNKNYFALSNHPKLMWYTLCLCKTDDGKTIPREWIGFKKKTTDNKLINFLEEHYPHLNSQEIEIMLAINTKNDFREMARDLGIDEATIKKII